MLHNSDKRAASLILVCALVASAAACAAAPVLDAARIRETTLPNGLHVIAKEAPGSGVVAVSFTIKAGPLYEDDKQHGLSDLVRYMMFDAGADGTPAASERLRDLGLDFNSYTSPDGTHIRATMAGAVLDEVFPQLVGAVFGPTFDEAVWARQVPELRKRLADAQGSAMGRMWTLLWETAFRQHPYGRPVAGVPDVLAAFDTQDLSRFHARFYVPNNAALIVAGDATAEQVFALAAAHLAGYPRQELLVPPVPTEEPLAESRVRLEKLPIRGTLIAYAWHAAGMRDKGDVCALDLLFALLAEGETARLPQALAAVKDADAVPQVEFITKRDPGLFVVWCACKADAEFGVRDAVESQVARLRDEKVTDQELATAKQLIRVGYAFDNQSFAGQVGSLGFYEAIDSYRFAADYVDLVERVTADDLQRVAGQYLGGSNYSLVIIRPKTGGGAMWEANLHP